MMTEHQAQKVENLCWRALVDLIGAASPLRSYFSGLAGTPSCQSSLRMGFLIRWGKCFMSSASKAIETRNRIK